MSHQKTLTVLELNEYIKMLLENNPTLKDIWVSGELSGVKVYPSGHMYFSLKDKDSVISSVMFKYALSGLDFLPEDGMKVLMHGRVSSYVPRGQYQFICDRMTPDGAGAMAVAFEQLKQKLMAEGLFDEARKKPIPARPRRIGIVTSPSGAAVHDIIRVAKGRYAGVELLIFPSLVQGDKAAAYLAGGIDYFNSVKDHPKQGVDVIIIGRGGGSMEDLWAFNDERLARTIARSDIPIVSAVGHEVDFTICDFVADKRAATPSAAAELTVPDMENLLDRLDHVASRLDKAIESKLSRYATRWQRLSEARVLTAPAYVWQRRQEMLDMMQNRLLRGVNGRLNTAKHILGRATAKLESLSPLSVLGRGYAMAQTPHGDVVMSVEQLQVGDILQLKLSDGVAMVRVDETLPIPRKGN